MKRRAGAGLCFLTLLFTQSLGGSAEAIPVGAQCWADGLCRLNGCSPPDPDCPPITHFIYLTISRYTTSVLDNATADDILDEATDILQTDNGSGDVSCNVAFIRSGSVSTFSTGDGSIDSQTEWNTIIALAPDVKVVNQINYCGGIVFGAVGCAPQPGSSQVVVRFGTNHQEAIAWAHEYGHTQGLPHRTGDVVMNGTLFPRNTRVNTAECNAYN